MAEENVLEAVENTTPTPNAPDKYDASKLGKLEGLDAVRKKPGMYIGGTDERALHHCVSEVLDNSVDEHLANYCNRIDVTIHVEGSISIQDNGRGFNPKETDAHEQQRRGFGLIGISERARLLGGKLVIESSPGHGTTIRMRLALKDVRKDGQSAE